MAHSLLSFQAALGLTMVLPLALSGCSDADAGGSLDSFSPGSGGFQAGPETVGSGAAGFGTGGVATGGQASGGGQSLGSGGSADTGGADGTGGEAAGGNSQPEFHVFLLLGQSNMAGYPHAEDADKVENPRIKVLGFDNCAATGRVSGQWDIAAPPLHECWNSAIGPGDYFSKTLIDKYPAQDTIGLVPLAISGSKIEPFMKVGGEKYSWILSRARAAQDIGGVIEGILFHQGESNCNSSAWPNQVKTLVNDLRSDLELGDVPFLAGELLYSGGCSQHNTLVSQLPGLISNGHVVSAEGLGKAADDTWNLHFSHDAQVTFGKRYAEEMIAALGL